LTKIINNLALSLVFLFSFFAGPVIAQQKNTSPVVIAQAKQSNTAVIRGNRNSKIYHLSRGCPSYHKIAPRNIVVFNTEDQARAAGYRKAKNCR